MLVQNFGEIETEVEILCSCVKKLHHPLPKIKMKKREQPLGGHSPQKRVGMLGWLRKTFDLQYSENVLKLRIFKGKNSEICGPLEPKQ